MQGCYIWESVLKPYNNEQYLLPDEPATEGALCTCPGDLDVFQSQPGLEYFLWHLFNSVEQLLLYFCERVLWAGRDPTWTNLCCESIVI